MAKRTAWTLGLGTCEFYSLLQTSFSIMSNPESLENLEDS